MYFMLCFATAPGLFAREPASPKARNGVFTAALLEQLQARGATEDASRLLRLVGDAVRRATEGKQKPWTHSTLPAEDVFLLPSLGSGGLDSTVQAGMSAISLC